MTRFGRWERGVSKDCQGRWVDTRSAYQQAQRETDGCTAMPTLHGAWPGAGVGEGGRTRGWEGMTRQRQDSPVTCCEGTHQTPPPVEMPSLCTDPWKSGCGKQVVIQLYILGNNLGIFTECAHGMMAVRVSLLPCCLHVAQTPGPCLHLCLI